MINVETESIIASAIVMVRLLYGITIPLVDRLEKDISERVTRDTIIQVNGDTGKIRMVSGHSPNTTQ
ncbi:MAG: hypothetical protein KAJ09_09180 [Deltaproteobacteria bacterium]|nr:hypothetical protein [Deltaproteobacteria bacterium]